jgi:hypothetical protein
MVGSEVEHIPDERTVMLKKTMTVLLVAVVSLLLLPAASANAATTIQNCVSVATAAANPVTTCVKIQYRLQNDGDGVYVEKATYEVTSGCAQLKANKFDDLSWFIETSPGSLIGESLPAISKCSATSYNINQAGIDTGLTNFDLYYTVSLKDRTNPLRRDWRVNHDADMDGVWYGITASAVFF